MDWVYALSQVLTVVEYGLLGLSYLAKNRKAVVALDIASMTMGIVVFLLLGADLGMAMSVVVLLANFYYLWDENRHGAREGRKKRELYLVRDYVVLAVVLVMIGVLAVLTYDGPLSLLSVAATVLYEISIWQKSTKVYKFLGIPVAGCWMAYNGFVKSIFGVICELVMLAAAIYGYVKEVRGGSRRSVRKASGSSKRGAKWSSGRQKKGN